MAVFIGSVKKKGAYEIGGDSMPYIEFIEGAKADGYDTFNTFAQAKKALFKQLTNRWQDYKAAAKYVKALKEPNR